MKLLIEMIFRGLQPTINLDFLRKLIVENRELYFNFPKVSSVKTFDEIVEMINLNTYVDFVININNLHIYEKRVSNVFVNLGRSDNENEIEIMFFFDLNDLNEPTTKMNLEYLKKWAIEFNKEYGFDYLICQMDNANKDEYYFDSHGIDRL